MKKKPESNYTKVLHIFPQGSWHDEVMIAGNREGLLALKNAVEKALNNERFGESHAFVNDGEGFTILVAQLHPSEMDAFKVPYTDEHAKALKGQGTDPWDFFRPFVWGHAKKGVKNHE